MYLEILEPRLTPASPSFDWPVSSAISRDFEAFGAGDGGGPRVEVYLNNTRVMNEFVFEDTQRGGADVSLRFQDNDTFLLVGAGARGGPRLKTYEFDPRTQRFKLIGDEFIDNPALREGVSVKGGQARVGYQQHSERIAAPSVLHAQAYPGYHPDLTPIDLEISFIPLDIQAKLFANHTQVQVYNGNSITELSEFAYLKGQQTATLGDGNRTFDNVPSAAPGTRAIISTSSVWATVHEVGHTTRYILPLGVWEKEWIPLWQRSVWSNDYERLNADEAWAESLRRDISNEPNPVGVTQFLQGVL